MADFTRLLQQVLSDHPLPALITLNSGAYGKSIIHVDPHSISFVLPGLIRLLSDANERISSEAAHLLISFTALSSVVCSFIDDEVCSAVFKILCSALPSQGHTDLANRDHLDLADSCLLVLGNVLSDTHCQIKQPPSDFSGVIQLCMSYELYRNSAIFLLSNWVKYQYRRNQTVANEELASLVQCALDPKLSDMNRVEVYLSVAFISKSNSVLQFLIDSNFYTSLAEYIQQSTQPGKAAIQALGGLFAAEHPAFTTMGLSLRLLPRIVALAQDTDPELRRAVVWLLSNIAASSDEAHIQALFDDGAMQAVLHLAYQDPVPAVRFQCHWVINNVLHGGNSNQVYALLQLNVVEQIVKACTEHDATFAKSVAKTIHHLMHGVFAVEVARQLANANSVFVPRPTQNDTMSM